MTEQRHDPGGFDALVATILARFASRSGPETDAGEDQGCRLFRCAVEVK
jgi:hypothetical protein